MPAINFTHAVEDVERGIKCSTIRRTALVKKDEKFKLYTGMRTKKCRLLGEATCFHVEPIEITADCEVNYYFRLPFETLLKMERFTAKADFVFFFYKKYGLPFKGFIHMWGFFERSNDFTLKKDYPF